MVLKQFKKNGDNNIVIGFNTLFIKTKTKNQFLI